MNLSERLKILNNSQKTVFKLKDLQSLWGNNILNTKTAAKRMVAKLLLLKLSKNYYALDKNYNIYELANFIISPSYVSFDSALFLQGVCFQAKNSIDSVALLNFKKKIDNQIYNYFSMKKNLFFDLQGIVRRDNFFYASPERAILDSFYFGFLPNIDNQEKIDLRLLRRTALLYPKSIQSKIKENYGSKI